MSPDASTVVPLWLDHASVQVPDLLAATEHLDRRLGLRVTVSPAAPERHGRVYLDRTYLEVAGGSTELGWRAPMYSLRFEDPIALRAHLEAAGLGYRFGEYEGVDGTWDDVEIHADPVPMPILIRRTRPRGVARSWPPALAEPHRCGARTLAEVCVGVPSLEAALEPFRALLALDERPEPSTDPLSGRPRIELPTAPGRIVLLEGGSGEIERLVLGVDSVEATRDALGRLIREGDAVAWLDPVETFSLRFGFIEV